MSSHFIVGLTGPIGAGKSSVSALLREMGAEYIDADQVSRRVVLPGSPCLKDLADAFGNEILNDGVLDRKKLAAVAFSNAGNKRLLDEITHPYIAQETVRLIDEIPSDRIVVVEATLLPGSPLEPLCNATVAVIADDEVRLQRILQRDNTDEEAARMRMRSQPSCEDYCRLVNHIIVNDQSVEELRRQTKRLYTLLKEGCR